MEYFGGLNLGDCEPLTGDSIELGGHVDSDGARVILTTWDDDRKAAGSVVLDPAEFWRFGLLVESAGLWLLGDPVPDEIPAPPADKVSAASLVERLAQLRDRVVTGMPGGHEPMEDRCPDPAAS